MAGKCKEMNKIKQALRLHLDGESNRSIGRKLDLYKGTVNKYINMAELCGIPIPALLAMEEPEIERVLTGRHHREPGSRPADCPGHRRGTPPRPGRARHPSGFGRWHPRALPDLQIHQRFHAGLLAAHHHLLQHPFRPRRPPPQLRHRLSVLTATSRRGCLGKRSWRDSGVRRGIR